jgi:hypothetical protein
MDSLQYNYGAYDNLCGCTAMKATWKGGILWAGMFFLPAGGTWNTTQGYDLTGIIKVKFKARITSPGSVKILFGKTGDSSGTLDSVFTFSSSWNWYEFNLPSSLDYSNIVSGFGFVLSSTLGTPNNSTTWIDSVYYEGVSLASNYDSIINGFTVTASKLQNNDTVKIFLDSVYYNKDRSELPRFCLSTVCGNDTLVDLTLKNTAYSYDNALKVITEIALYKATNATSYLDDAKKTLHAFNWVIHHDRTNLFRLRNAYSSGDIWLHVNDSIAKLPGWYDETQKNWFEEVGSISISTGNIAWVALSFLSAYEISSNTDYLNSACQLAQWCIDSLQTGFGFTGGFEGRDGNQLKDFWKSTEHNIDLYSVFSRCFVHTHDSTYYKAGQNAHHFVLSMWDSVNHHFWTGTDVTGITPDKSAVPLDAQSWYILAFQDSTSSYAQGCYQWVQDSLYESNYASQNYANLLCGYRFSNKGDNGIWCEGSGQMAQANIKMGHPEIANALFGSLEYMQSCQLHPKFYNLNGKGIPAADHNHLQTGFTWDYSNRLSLAPTCWYILAKLNFNPFTEPISFVTWNGNVSEDWNDPLNWTPNIVPDEFQDAIIPSVPNLPIVNGIIMQCRNLTILSNSIVTIPNSMTLIVYGNIHIYIGARFTNNGYAVIKGNLQNDN